MAKTNPIRELFREQIKNVLGKDIEDLEENDIPAYIKKAEIEYKVLILQEVVEILKRNIELI